MDVLHRLPAHLILQRHLLRAGFDAEEQNVVVGVLDFCMIECAVPAFARAGRYPLAHLLFTVLIRRARGRAKQTCRRKAK